MVFRVLAAGDGHERLTDGFQVGLEFGRRQIVSFDTHRLPPEGSGDASMPCVMLENNT
jgi:hypothetical protein